MSTAATAHDQCMTFVVTRCQSEWTGAWQGGRCSVLWTRRALLMAVATVWPPLRRWARAAFSCFTVDVRCERVLWWVCITAQRMTQVHAPELSTALRRDIVLSGPCDFCGVADKWLSLSLSHVSQAVSGGGHAVSARSPLRSLATWAPELILCSTAVPALQARITPPRPWRGLMLCAACQPWLPSQSMQLGSCHGRGVVVLWASGEPHALVVRGEVGGARAAAGRRVCVVGLQGVCCRPARPPVVVQYTETSRKGSMA